MLKAFNNVARLVTNAGGEVALELPRQCDYWDNETLQATVHEFGLQYANFDGCSVGLRNNAGELMYTPWRVATSCVSLWEALRNRTCTGDHNHARCEGANTQPTQRYTPKLARIVHDAWRKDCKLTPDRCYAWEAVCPNTHYLTTALPGAPVWDKVVSRNVYDLNKGLSPYSCRDTTEIDVNFMNTVVSPPSDMFVRLLYRPEGPDVRFPSAPAICFQCGTDFFHPRASSCLACENAYHADQALSLIHI